MLSAGTTERDSQIALSLAYVMWKQVNQQIGNPGHKFRSLRKGPDILCHCGVLSSEVLESRNVVGIRQKPDIKNEVAVRRHSVAETETGDVDLNRGLIALAPEAFPDKIA